MARVTLEIVTTGAAETQAAFQKIEQAFRAAGVNTGIFGQALAALSGPLGAIGGALTVMGAAATAGVAAIARNTVEVRNLMAVSGLGAEAADNLADAFSLVGVESGTLTQAMFKMSSEIDSGGEGLKKLGVSLRDSQGLLKTEGQLFLEVLDKVQGLGTAYERSAALMEVFGRGGRELVAVGNMNREAFKALLDEAKKYSDWTERQQAIGQDFLVAQNRVQLALGGIAQVIGTALVPELTRAGNAFASWLVEFRGSETLANAAEDVVILARALDDLGSTLSGMVTSVGAVFAPLEGITGRVQTISETIRATARDVENLSNALAVGLNAALSVIAGPIAWIASRFDDGLGLPNFTKAQQAATVATLESRTRLQESVETYEDTVVQLREGTREFIAYGGALEETGKKAGGADRAMKGAAEAAEKVADGLQKAGQKLTGIANAFGDADVKALADVANAFEEIAHQVEGIKLGGAAAEKAAAQIREMGRAAVSLTEGQQALKRFFDEVKRAEEVNKFFADLQKSIDEVNMTALEKKTAAANEQIEKMTFLTPAAAAAAKELAAGMLAGEFAAELEKKALDEMIDTLSRGEHAAGEALDAFNLLNGAFGAIGPNVKNFDAEFLRLTTTFGDLSAVLKQDFADTLADISLKAQLLGSDFDEMGARVGAARAHFDATAEAVRNQRAPMEDLIQATADYKAALADQKLFSAIESGFLSITDTFTKMANGLIAGTLDIGQAFADLGQSLLTNFVQLVIHQVFDPILSAAASFVADFVKTIAGGIFGGGGSGGGSWGQTAGSWVTGLFGGVGGAGGAAYGTGAYFGPPSPTGLGPGDMLGAGIQGGGFLANLFSGGPGVLDALAQGATEIMLGLKGGTPILQNLASGFDVFTQALPSIGANMSTLVAGLGVAYAAYNAIDALAKGQTGTGVGGLVGLGVGAGVGFLAGGPFGALLGAGIGGAAGGLFGSLFDEDWEALRAERTRQRNLTGTTAFGAASQRVYGADSLTQLIGNLQEGIGGGVSGGSLLLRMTEMVGNTIADGLTFDLSPASAKTVATFLQSAGFEAGEFASGRVGSVGELIAATGAGDVGAGIEKWTGLLDVLAQFIALGQTIEPLGFSLKDVFAGGLQQAKVEFALQMKDMSDAVDFLGLSIKTVRVTAKDIEGATQGEMTAFAQQFIQQMVDAMMDAPPSTWAKAAGFFDLNALKKDSETLEETARGVGLALAGLRQMMLDLERASKTLTISETLTETLATIDSQMVEARKMLSFADPRDMLAGAAQMAELIRAKWAAMTEAVQIAAAEVNTLTASLAAGAQSIAKWGPLLGAFGVSLDGMAASMTALVTSIPTVEGKLTALAGATALYGTQLQAAVPQGSGAVLQLLGIQLPGAATPPGVGAAYSIDGLPPGIAAAYSDGLAPGAGPGGGAPGAALLAGFQSALDAILTIEDPAQRMADLSTLLDQFGATVTATTDAVRAAYEAEIAAVSALVSAINGYASQVANAGSAIANNAGFLAQAGVDLRYLATTMTGFAVSLPTVAGSLTALGSAVDLFGASIEVGQTKLDGGIQGLVEALATVRGGGAFPGAVGAGPAVPDIMALISDTLGGIPAGLADAFAKAMQITDPGQRLEALTGVLNTLGAFMGTLPPALQAALASAFGPEIRVLIEAIQAAAGEQAAAAQRAAEQLTNLIKSSGALTAENFIVQKIGEMNTVLGKIADGAGKFATDLTKAMQDAGKDIADALDTASGELADVLGTLSDAVGQLATAENAMALAARGMQLDMGALGQTIGGAMQSAVAAALSSYFHPLQTGADFVAGGFALLHPREMVLSPRAADIARAMGITNASLTNWPLAGRGREPYGFTPTLPVSGGRVGGDGAMAPLSIPITINISGGGGARDAEPLAKQIVEFITRDIRYGAIGRAIDKRRRGEQ